MDGQAQKINNLSQVRMRDSKSAWDIQMDGRKGKNQDILMDGLHAHGKEQSRKISFRFL